MMNSVHQPATFSPLDGARRGVLGHVAPGIIHQDDGSVAADVQAVPTARDVSKTVEISSGGAGGSSAAAPRGEFSITFPWPNAGLSQNGRGRWQKRARLVKEARAAAGKLAWDRGLHPLSDLRPVRVVFHPPPRGTRDKTNMIAMWKAVEDGIADALAVDDAKFDPAYDVGPKIEGGAIVVIFSEIPAT